MKPVKYLCLLLWIILIPGIATGQKTPADYVNVFTGTSNSRWMLFPGPSMPFGMVKLSPDNQDNVWNGGYEYTVGSISGFSHLHAMSLGGLSLMPVSGKTALFPGPSDGPFGQMWTSGYRSRYEKKTEKGSPGYYSVYLYDYDIRTELTSTERCGMMRFTWEKEGDGHIIVNFAFPQEEKYTVREAHASQTTPGEITGYIKETNQYAQDYTVFFVLQTDHNFTMDGWTMGKYDGADTNYGTNWRRPVKETDKTLDFTSSGDCGLVLNLTDFRKGEVLVRTGISFTGIDGARLNLQKEMIPFGWDFDAVVTAARRTWNDLLGKVEVKTSDTSDIEKFYTGLYRAFTGKSIMSDVDGKFTDMCENVRILDNPGDAVYSSDAFWGAQWNLFPLWTLVTPEYARSMTASLVDLAKVGGWIPEAPTGIEYAPIMGAQHQNSLIVSCYQKGIRDFDVDTAWHAILHDYTTPGIEYPCGGFAGDRQMGPYMKYGYVPDEYGPVSNTMEYAYDDWVFSQFSLALGKEKEYQHFLDRSKNYRNVFDPETRFIRRRHKDGSWVTPFNPLAYGTTGGWNGPGYMEGNAWVYSFFVPQNIPDMMKLMGDDLFNERLETGIEQGYFDLGNQPGLEIPFIFNYSGKPWLTQKYSRMVTSDLINTSPLHGWEGEEDEGQMSAMYVLLSMGLFEVDGGCSVNPGYDIGSPVFDTIVIHLSDTYYGGHDFMIRTINNSSENMYIQEAWLNGKPLYRPFLPHSELVKGGELVLKMGSKPNYNWFKM